MMMIKKKERKGKKEEHGTCKSNPNKSCDKKRKEKVNQ